MTTKHMPYQFATLQGLLSQVVDGAENSIFAVVTSDKGKVVSHLGWKVGFDNEFVDSFNNCWIFISDNNSIQRSTLHALQLDGVFFIESHRADWNEKMFALSRVRRYKLLDEYQFVNIHKTHVDTWQAYYVKTGLVMNEEKE